MLLIRDLGVINFGSYKARMAIYECEICKKHFEARVSTVKKNNQKNCRKCKKNNNNEKHGMSHHKLYRIYISMIQRCTDSNSRYYKEYGGRGITVCLEWVQDKTIFFEWALLNGYTDGLSIDRIDNNKGYSPQNCRWTNNVVQGANTRAIRSSNRSGCRGVSWHKASKKWRVQISVNKNRLILGSFDSKEEACAKYISYVRENNLPHNIEQISKEEAMSETAT